MSSKEVAPIDQDVVQQIVNASHGYSDAVIGIERVNKEFKNLEKYVKGDIQLINERLKKYPTIEELRKYIKIDDNVESFFINEDGTQMKIANEDGSVPKEKELLGIKRQILIYMREATTWKHDMEMMLEEFDKQRKEIEESMGVTANEIVVNQLRLAQQTKKELEEAEEPVEDIKKKLKHINHIISGFDFNILLSVIEDHPTIPRNTIKEMRKEDAIFKYGQRYRAAINKSGSLATLVSFISNSPSSSFEEIYMPPDKYRKGYENLFLFSIIRFFAMERWTDSVKRMHAMMVSLLQQFINDELPSDIKDQFIDNIGNYLAVFYAELDK